MHSRKPQLLTLLHAAGGVLGHARLSSVRRAQLHPAKNRIRQRISVPASCRHTGPVMEGNTCSWEQGSPRKMAAALPSGGRPQHTPARPFASTTRPWRWPAGRGCMWHSRQRELSKRTHREPSGSRHPRQVEPAAAAAWVASLLVCGCPHSGGGERDNSINAWLVPPAHFGRLLGRLLPCARHGGVAGVRLELVKSRKEGGQGLSGWVGAHAASFPPVAGLSLCAAATIVDCLSPWTGWLAHVSSRAAPSGSQGMPCRRRRSPPCRCRSSADGQQGARSHNSSEQSNSIR